MSAKPSFAERLRAKRLEEDKKITEEAQKARELVDEQKRQERIDKEKKIRAYKRLVELGEERIIPVFKVLNSEYLRGKGKITFSPSFEEACDEKYLIEKGVWWIIELVLESETETRLVGIDMSATFVYRKGEALSVVQYLGGKVQIYAGGVRFFDRAYTEGCLLNEEPLATDSPSDLTKIEDLIFNSLNIISCSYEFECG